MTFSSDAVLAIDLVGGKADTRKTADWKIIGPLHHIILHKETITT